MGTALATVALWQLAYFAPTPLRTPTGKPSFFAPLHAPRVRRLEMLDHTMLHDGLCAFAASGLSTALLHPIDTIKTRLQCPDYSGPPLVTVSCVVLLAGHALHGGLTPPSRPQEYGVPPLVTSGRRAGLFDDLYRGVGASIFKEVP